MSGIPEDLPKSLFSGSLTRLCVSGSQDCSHSRHEWGKKRHFQAYSCECWQASCPHWLFSRKISSLTELSTWKPVSLRSSKQENKSEHSRTWKKATEYCDIIFEVRCHGFCYILLAVHHEVQPTVKGRSLHTQRGHFRSHLPQMVKSNQWL